MEADERDEEVETLILDLHELKTKKELLEAEISERQTVLLNHLKNFPEGKYKQPGVAATTVKGTMTKWDEEKLQELLSKTMWNAVSRRQLDVSLLEAMVEAGKLNVSQIKDALSITAKKPYVKLTVKRGAK